jgi:hypothetical protein
MAPYQNLADRIKSLRCLGEVEGFEAQMQLDGRLTPEVINKLAIRRAELKKQRKDDGPGN